MIRRNAIIILVGMPALGIFVNEYIGGWFADGRPPIYELAITGVCLLIVPWIIAWLIAAQATSGLWRRLLAFSLSAAFAYGLIWLFPSPGRSRLLGQASRLRHEMSLDELLSSAVRIREKEKDKTLRTTIPPKEYASAYENMHIVFVDLSELPQNLQSTFDFVAIYPRYICFGIKGRHAAILITLEGFRPTKEELRLAEGMFLLMR